jgi:alpha-ketoglutarate-dependent taurine dioxygenase
MAGMSVAIVPLEAPFGAMVTGWEPAKPLDDDDLLLVRDALHRSRLLVFRGHPVPTNEELTDLAARFGELAPASELYGIALDAPKVLKVSNELDERGYEQGAAGSGSIPWHTDYAFMERPAKETFLEAFRLPPGGGPQTCFCDMYAALQALPSELRTRVDGLVGRHTLMAAAYYGTADADPAERDARSRQANPDLRYPDDGAGVPHPVVVRHPETGQEALYVSSFVDRFDGVDFEEGRALLDELLRRAVTPERTYGHSWQVGDLVVFDTVGTVHARGLVKAAEPRTMRQMSTLVAAGW